MHSPYAFSVRLRPLPALPPGGRPYVCRALDLAARACGASCLAGHSVRLHLDGRSAGEPSLRRVVPRRVRRGRPRLRSVVIDPTLPALDVAALFGAAPSE